MVEKSGITMTVQTKGKDNVYSYPAIIKVTAVTSVFEKYNKNVKVSKVTLKIDKKQYTNCKVK